MIIKITPQGQLWRAEVWVDDEIDYIVVDTTIAACLRAIALKY